MPRPRSLLLTIMYSLLVQSVEGITWVPGPIHHKTPNLYVAVYGDGIELQRTRTVKRQLAPKWDYLVKITEPLTIGISLKVFHDSSFPGMQDKCIASVKCDLAVLSKLCDSEGDAKVVNLELIGAGGKFKGHPAGEISVKLMREGQTAALGIIKAQENVEKIAGNVKLSAARKTEETVESMSMFADLASALASVASKLEILVHVGDEIAAIHPYANIAWKVLTSVYKAMKKQQATDEKLQKLVETMVDVYSFVEDVEFLAQKIKSLEDKALAIVKQTVECALFIQEYTANGFCDRTVRNMWTNTDQKIEDLSGTLLQLREAFDGRLMIQGLFLSTKVLGKLEGLEQSDMLRKLNPVDMNASSRPMCLPGTRQKILDSVVEWLNSPSGSGNIHWLSGVAGCGKSTISTTISEYFRAIRRLGAFLFFDRNEPAKSHPDAVIQTIAHSLALFNPQIGSAISAVIHDDPAVVNAPMQTQFKQLLLDPLQSSEQFMSGPILIILDALDECGDYHSRATLLSLLSSEFHKLPKLFRILITSRPDPDIVNKFSQARFVETPLHAGPLSMQDVDVFIRDKISQIQQGTDLGPTWPAEKDIRTLINLSGGLFIWASTAIRFIDGYQPGNRLQILITQHSDGGFNLDVLYSLALENLGSWADSNFAKDAQAVLACIVLGSVPMTDRTIDMLLYAGQRSSREVLNHLGCVIQWSQGKEARTLHASFADYLTDPVRSGGKPWAINQKVHSLSLSLGCLRILNSELRFNICELEDSHCRNVDVDSLSARVTKNILPQLQYASQFWGDHIKQSPFDDELLKAVDGLLSQKLLYWLEVLSLLDQVSVATVALGIAARYVKGKALALHALTADAIQFVDTFSPVIAQSAPHLYLSAVPFAPRQSKISAQFGPLFPGTVQFQSTLTEDWPAIQKIFQNMSTVNSVNFSPDGTRIASGSSDGTIQVWDTHTGTLFAGPFEGHKGTVACVDFSPDGLRIASGSNDRTIRVWNAQTGALPIGPLEGHTDEVNSVNFSPDGMQIVSGSDDKTIRVWDAQTGALLAGPFEGHDNYVRSVNFSPDGMKIASGSADTTIRVWDAQTGILIAGPFHGHTNWVRSVNFSPDGMRVVSGSDDKSIRVWDAQTGELLTGPLEGHTDWVKSVKFLPDGTQIISGSNDKTIWVWDAQTGALLAGPFDGHLGVVTSVDVSPDGKWVVSGSNDNTIRVWNVQTSSAPLQVRSGVITSVNFSPDGGRIVSGSSNTTLCVWDSRSGALLIGPLEGHTDEVKSVNFSPDGMQIVSGSDDQTIRVWDAQTGALLAGPFEGHDNHVTSVNFSPDGMKIASGSADETIRVWDAQTGILIAGSFRGHTDWVRSVNFSPDGMRVASGSDDKSIRVWDAQTGELLTGPFEGHTNWVFSVHFSPKGDLIVSGSTDHTVQVWNAQTGALFLGPFEGHTDWVNSVKFSPAGDKIASGSDDNTIRVWDAQSGTLVAGPFGGHTEFVKSVDFSPDSTYIVSGSSDGTIRVWELNSSVSNSSEEYSLRDDGWCRNSNGDLLFWVPPWRREGLYLPRNTLIISDRGTTKPDLSRFVHGRNWQKCIDPKLRISNSV